MSLLLLVVLFVNITGGLCYPTNGLIRRPLGFDEPVFPGVYDKPKQEPVPKDVSGKIPELILDQQESVAKDVIEKKPTNLANLSPVLPEKRLDKSPPQAPHVESVSPISKIATTTTAKPGGEIRKKPKMNEMESGAVMRGVWVLVGISVLFMIYLATKNYCKRNKVATMIRKYGVDSRTSEVQMTLLSLRDDEEDETVFDVSSVPR